jgi:vitamin B12 transporter
MRAACEGELMKTIISAGMLFLATVPAWAQEPETTETIIVTATRTEIPLARATVPVDVITRDEIELSLASDLAELLRFEAGIDIGRNGGPGQATSIFLRGTESNHTLILIDGVRINPGTLGGAAIQNIAPEMIERVEIVKGARSALFGTDALGGVINVITRRSQKSYAEATVGGGSFDTQSGTFSMGGTGGSSEFGISLNYNDTSGFPAQTASDIDRGYDNTTINLHGGLELGNSFVSLRLWSATGTTEYLDFFLAPLDQEFANRSTSLEVQSDFSDSLNSRLVVGQMNDDITQNQSDDFVESTRLSLDWQLSWTTPNHVVTGGLYYMDEDAASFSFGSGFDETTTSSAVFAQDQWTRGRHQTFFALRLTDHETFGSETTWNAEYAFAMTDSWTLHAGLAHAFRAPDATDRFGFGGNPDLAPEIADEVQLGLRYRPGGPHSLSLELYRNEIEDIIEFDLATFTLRNIAKAEIRGAELTWDYVGDGFSVRASVVKQKAENPLDDVRLLRRAEESATLSVIRNLGLHRVGVSLLASGDRMDFGGIRLPGYALVNLTGQLAVGQHWRVNARIENLLDKEYQTAAGFNMQDLSGFVELNYSWR